MRATDFEHRHQLLLHELIVGAAVLTYLIDGDDIVWRFIKDNGPNVRTYERSMFALATLLFGISAWICTRARAYEEIEKTAQSAELAAAKRSRSLDQLRYLGEFLFAVALGSLLPLAGFLILVIGESIRLLRLFWGDTPLTRSEDSAGDISQAVVTQLTSKRASPAKQSRPEWARASRRETIKWGLFLTMIVFTITLKDRLAEGSICATVLLWVLLNLGLRGNPPTLELL